MITTVFLSIIGLTIIERIVELRVGQRNLAWSLERGGVESGQGHWPWMVTLHTVFLGAMVAEALFTPTRQFSDDRGIGDRGRRRPGPAVVVYSNAGSTLEPRVVVAPIFRASRPALIVLQPPQLHRCRCRRHRPADDSWMLADSRWVYHSECPPRRWSVSAVRMRPRRNGSS